MYIDETVDKIIVLLNNQTNDISIDDRKKIEKHIACYAISALMDSKVAEEVNKICESIDDGT